MFSQVAKSGLFTAGVGCIAAGSKLVESDVRTGVMLIVLGIAIVMIYAYFLEKQTTEKAVKLVMKHFGGEKRGRKKNSD